ncbi:cytochrome d ubiquinol oxidase subunit II [Pseudogracilibacillus auburnensis]|uniref:cytochrome d ubiquinol oxidase subunit II n=1 Tax=Pseudogracilibacillus auburnensis TaxID=1494959 RepID=UPI000D758276|nr:cytochrome d ubiquinol oxidase subunit II [Pseudogracilibacillus auburnensis]MBO1003633.1 cytochrome d ubiquinol oxidase subunit II [Pseudogracilibacillus auburnensis]
MDIEIVGITVLWTFLFGYLIIGSIDYGAGFFNAYNLLTDKEHVLTKIIQRYLSPVWEVTNVFLVFFFVGIIGFFPKTAFYYGTVLLVPVSIALLLLAIRGSYYAFETYGARGHKGYSFMYGLSGLLLPASLSIVLTISEGGFVHLDRGKPVLNYFILFISPLTWSIFLLSITAVLYISAVFLTWYAHKAKDTLATNVMRKYALIWSLPSIITASSIIYQLKFHNDEHFNRLMHLWWMFALSLLFFVGTVLLLWAKRNYGFAFISLIAQYALAFYGYGISHYPYLLYPFLTLYDSFTNEAMAISLIIAFILGLGLLIPSLYLLLRLFLFNKGYVKGNSDYY